MVAERLRHGVGAVIEPSAVNVALQVRVPVVEHFWACRERATWLKLTDANALACVIVPNGDDVGVAEVPLFQRQGVGWQVRRLQIDRAFHLLLGARDWVDHVGDDVVLCIPDLVLEAHDAFVVRVWGEENVSKARVCGIGDQRGGTTLCFKHSRNTERSALPASIIGQQLVLADVVRAAARQRVAAGVTGQDILDRQGVLFAQLDLADV